MKNFFSYSFLIIAIFGILLGADRLLHAQTVDPTFDPLQSGEIQQQVQSSIVPENPLPGQDVTISLTAYGSDINTANISWSVNGTVIQKGTGLDQFSFTAGKNGEAKNVVATILFENLPVITKTFTITPQEVSILYEADSYTPPFYKGKGLYGLEGTVTFVAIPNIVSSTGIKLNPNNLIYKWTIDGTVLGSKSGYGKNSLSYTGSILGKDVFVMVDVTSPDKTTTGKGIMLLSVEKPEVLLYEKNPLYGILFNKELSSNGISLSEREVTIEAIPFSTSASNANSNNLSYSWLINSSKIPVPTNQNYVTFRNATGQKGSSLVSVLVNNTDHFLQQMQNSLSIKF
jgi:hypothetical protein